MAKVVRGTRITGTQREALAAQYAKKYEAGQSIRKIAESGGRSFGFVHGVLVEHGVTLRGRGGATPANARSRVPRQDIVPEPEGSREGSQPGGKAGGRPGTAPASSPRHRSQTGLVCVPGLVTL